jgi:hypothetical protein
MGENRQRSLENIDLSFDNMSSTDSSDFIRGLREIGLASETTQSPDPPQPVAPPAEDQKSPKTTTPVQTEPAQTEPVQKEPVHKEPVQREPPTVIHHPEPESPTQPTRKAAPPKETRRRRPGKLVSENRRDRLTFAELLSDDAVTVTAVHPVAEEPDTDVEGMEARLAAYFNRTMTDALESVKTEILNLLESSWAIDDVTSDFLHTFRTELKQLIAFHRDSLHSFAMGSDLISSDFLATISSVHKYQHTAISGKLDAVRVCRGLVSGHRSVQEHSFGAGVSDISTELRSLRKAKVRTFQERVQSEQQTSKARRELVELEVKAIRQRAGIQLLEARRELMPVARDTDSETLDVRSSIQDITALFQATAPASALSEIRRFRPSERIRDKLSDLSGLRIMHERNHGILCRHLVAFKAILDNLASPLAVPSVVIHPEPRVSHTEVSLSEQNLRSKLESQQAERERELQNVSTFLDTVRRQSHRTRRRRQH